MPAQDFQVGETLPASALINLPWGVMGYAEVTANQGSITSIVDLTSLTITFTAQANRRYKITGSANFSSTTAGDTILGYITNGAGTQLARFFQSEGQHAGGSGSSETGSIVEAPGAGSITYKLRAERSGSGTVTMNAGATFPAFILVEDIGPT